jgi:hypothetical protein
LRDRPSGPSGLLLLLSAARLGRAGHLVGANPRIIEPPVE